MSPQEFDEDEFSFHVEPEFFTADADAMPNTMIRYMYRDADNYKQASEEIFEGRMTLEQLRKIAGHLDEDGGFIPGQVGMKDLQGMMAGGWDEQSDHPFHEMLSVSPTSDTTTNASVEELVRAFEAVSWDQEYRPEK